MSGSISLSGGAFTKVNTDSVSSGTGLTNTGDRSHAFGTSSKILDLFGNTSVNCFAGGDQCEAEGAQSFAWGDRCIASTGRSAPGYKNPAPAGTFPHGSINYDAQFAFGSRCYADVGYVNFAFGYYCFARNYNTFAFGGYCYAIANNSFVFGRNNISYANGTFVLGNANTVGTMGAPSTGRYSLVLGQSCSLTGKFSFVLGNGLNVVSDYCFAMGQSTVEILTNSVGCFNLNSRVKTNSSHSFASGTSIVWDYSPGSFAHGPATWVEDHSAYSFATGRNVRITSYAPYSFAQGNSSRASGRASFATGEYAQALRSQQVTRGSNRTLLGAAQTSFLVKHTFTLDAIQKVLATLDLEQDKAYNLSAKVIGRNTDTNGQNASFFLDHALAYRDTAGAAVLESGPTIALAKKETGAAGTAAEITQTGNNIELRVTGNIDRFEWTCKFEFIEVLG